MDKFAATFLTYFLEPAHISSWILPVTLIAIALLAWLSYFVAVKVLTPFILVFVRKTSTKWDDDLLTPEVIRAFCQIVPAIIVAWLLPETFVSYKWLFIWISRLTKFYIVWAVVNLALKLLTSFNRALDKRDMMQEHNFSVIIQAFKLVAVLIGVIVGIGIVISRSPIAVLTAFGASAAILMLVFKDTILGFVAGIQLSINGMLKKGDWIIAEKAGANGEVESVKLTTVKIKNWDNSVTTIPPYTLVSESFQNYQNMRRAGTRRIARSVYIDMNTIRFLTVEELEDLRSEGWLEGVEIKSAERTVNIGLLRRYLEAYLSRHPHIRVKDKGNSTVFMMVRQLQPTPTGLPLELYFFTDITNWKKFEALQSDIFDHVFAVIPRFGLSVFQSPAGTDIKECR